MDYKNKERRLEKEIACYKLLDKLEIAYVSVDHSAANTIADCTDVGEMLGIEICKNLFLCNTQKTNFYLLMLSGEKVFKTKDISKQLGIARLSFAPPEYMEEYLNILPGSVSVMGLMNDRENHVRLLIDRDLLKQEYVGCHPCVNTSSLKILTKDLTEKFLPAIGHCYTEVIVE